MKDWGLLTSWKWFLIHFRGRFETVVVSNDEGEVIEGTEIVQGDGVVVIDGGENDVVDEVSNEENLLQQEDKEVVIGAVFSMDEAAKRDEQQMFEEMSSPKTNTECLTEVKINQTKLVEWLKALERIAIPLVSFLQSTNIEVLGKSLVKDALGIGFSTSETDFIAFDFDKRFNIVSKRNILIFDPGGGTLDAPSMKLNLTTGLTPNLNVSAAPLAFIFIRAWSKFIQKIELVSETYTKQDNIIIQTFVVACYGIAVGGGFRSYLLGIIVSFPYLNYRGLNIVGFSAIMLVCFWLLPFVVMGVLSISRIRPRRWFVVDYGKVDWMGYFTSLFWNLNYWNNASILAGEIENSTRTFLRALLGAVFVVVRSYLVPPPASTEAVETNRSEWSDGYFAQIGMLSGGAWLKWWIQVAAVLHFEAKMSSDAFQLLAMSEIGMLPSIFASRSEYGTPTFSILCSASGVIFLSWMSFQEILEFLNFIYPKEMLLTTWEKGKESVVVEGVHLRLNFVMGLMKKHPSNEEEY